MKEGDRCRASSYAAALNTTVAKKRMNFSKTSLKAGDRLLKAVKRKLLREKGKISYVALRRGGYSESLILRLKAV